MTAVLAKDERRSRLYGSLAACTLGLLIAVTAQEGRGAAGRTSLPGAGALVGLLPELAITFQARGSRRRRNHPVSTAAIQRPSG